MAITLLGQPFELSSAYNPLYFYASSTNATEPNFRYIVQVTDTVSSDVLAELHIRPRFGDNYLEVDIAKIIQSRLATFTDDVDINNNDNTWNNTPSSGFQYTVNIGEEYLAEWEWTQLNQSSFMSGSAYPIGNVRIGGVTASPYSVGDFIYVTGGSEQFNYISIVDNGGFAQINVDGTHTFSNGDIATILQSSPYDYPQYSGSYSITDASNPSYIVINAIYQGFSYLPQTGTVTKNVGYSGNAQVVQLVTAGLYYLDLAVPFVDFPTPGLSGTTRYLDSRLSQFLALQSTTRSVFNGAVRYNTFPQWDSEPFINNSTSRFLTSVPNYWRVREDNSIFLDFASIPDIAEPGLTTFLEVNTYDSSNNLLNTYTFSNLIDPSNKTLIQNVAVGPMDLNSTNVIGNGGFNNNNGSYWAITNSLGGIAAILNNTLVYSDNVTGDGTSSAVQFDTLTPGKTYVVTLTTSSNNFVIVSVGDENDLYPIATQGQNGTYTYTFTATGTEFWLTMDSAGGVTQGVIIDDVSVLTTDLIDCDVDHYTVQIFKADVTGVITNGSFASSSNWTIVNYDNANTFIADGELIYEDAVEFGGPGYSTITQTGALTIGETYVATVNIPNNSNCTVFLGDSNYVYLASGDSEIGNYSAIFIAIFVATSTDYVIQIVGNDLFTNGAEINSTVVYYINPEPQSELRTFTLDCSCTGRYTNYPLLFMDRGGSFIPFNFELNNKQKVDIKRTKYQRFIGELSNSLSTPGYSYSLNDSSSRIYNVELNEEWELNSNWLSEADAAYAEELFTSPLVSLGIQGTWVAVNVLDTTFERVRKNNKKMIRITIKIAFSNNNNIQTA